MDLNLVVLAGHLAAEPEIRTFESGTTLMRLLVTVRSSEPMRRLDVVPVVQWSPDPDDMPEGSVRGRPVWIAGAVQRRFWSATDGRHSRVEIIAHEVVFRDVEPSTDDEFATAS